MSVLEVHLLVFRNVVEFGAELGAGLVRPRASWEPQVVVGGAGLKGS